MYRVCTFITLKSLGGGGFSECLNKHTKYEVNTVSLKLRTISTESTFYL